VKASRSRGDIAVTAAASLVNIACLVGEAAALLSIQTTIHVASDLVPHFPLMITAYCALEVAAVVGLFATMRQLEKGVSAKRRYLTTLGYAAAALVCACLASFVVRFCFYCMHMTVGM
jgi:anaerobic dimethyl sulfoxide reductase subunit C (anchor subunit)